jgi:hypothetical protein
MTHMNYGNLLARLHRNAEAEVEFFAALAIDPGLEAAQKNLERVHAAQERN